MSIYIPYTYLIGWSSQNKFYYGRRTAKNCHPSDLWVKYFTSSKIVKQFIKDHGEPDIIEIRKTFTNSVACSKWECKVLERMNVAHNDKFLNKKNGDYKWDTTGMSFMGRKHSEETKAKISKANGGRHCTEEHKEKLRQALSGRKNPGAAIRMSKWNSTKEAKTYLVSYNGSPWEEMTNLYQFCQQNNLRHRAAYKVLNGELESHKGWKFKHINQ